MTKPSAKGPCVQARRGSPAKCKEKDIHLDEKESTAQKRLREFETYVAISPQGTHVLDEDDRFINVAMAALMFVPDENDVSVISEEELDILHDVGLITFDDASCPKQALSRYLLGRNST